MALTPSFLRPPCKTRSRAPLQHFPSPTTTPSRLGGCCDEMARRRTDDLSSGESQDVSGQIGRVLSTQKIERLDLAPTLSRTPIHGARVCVQGNKSVIESILFPSSSYGNASVPRPTRNGGCSLLLGFFLLVLCPSSLSSSSSTEI